MTYDLFFFSKEFLFEEAQIKWSGPNDQMDFSLGAATHPHLILFWFISVWEILMEKLADFQFSIIMTGFEY